MSSADSREKSLDAFGPILIKQGYDWVDLEDVAQAGSMELSELSDHFPNKALLCESWMERTDDRTKAHHAKLLSSNRPPQEVVDEYFETLEKFMVENGFGGCPFSNTARALRGKSEPSIELRIVEHKSELRRFFRKLCTNSVFQWETVSEAIFLIYSGATTESFNTRSLEPIKASRQVVSSLFDLYANHPNA